ncbi:MAG: hypothetical protein U1E23_17060 [Reyranellaceae bacterium]
MAEHKTLADALADSVRTIDADYKEEARELRLLFEDARREAEKDQPDGAKLKALLADANEMVKTVAGLDPVWDGVQRIAKMFGFL